MGLLFGSVWGYLTPGYFDWVILSGWSIPIENIDLDYFKALLWAILLGTTIIIWPVSKKTKTALAWIWSAKVATALGFLLVYESKYPSDQWSYFTVQTEDDYVPMDLKLIFQHSEEHSTRNIDVISWWLNSNIPLDSYHALKISFAMVGLISVFVLYRAATILMEKKENIPLLYFLGLIPTTLVWSSTLGKEPIVLIGVSFYIYGVISWHKQGKVLSLSWSVLGLIIAGSTRVWMLPILLIPMFIFIFSKKLNFLVRTILMILVLLFSVKFFHYAQASPGLRMATQQDFLDKASLIANRNARGGSAIKPVIYNSLGDVIKFLPIGIFTALYRPLPGDISNLFGIAASFEGVLLLGLTFRAIKRTSWSDFKNPLLLWITLVVLCWALIYAFASQNLGTLMRWRLQIFPVFQILLLYLGRVRT